MCGLARACVRVRIFPTHSLFAVSIKAVFSCITAVVFLYKLYRYNLLVSGHFNVRLFGEMGWIREQNKTNYMYLDF